MSNDITVEDVLAHFGVKGMHWGVRRGDYPGASTSTNREAKKDAGEFARAKMFYGEGAGTRRKLIKATVDSKAKKDPQYKAAFDHHLANQNMGQHASKARKERRRKDVTAKTSKTARGVHRSLTGGFGSTTLASAVIASGLVAAHRSGIDQVIFNAAKSKMGDVQATNSAKAAAKKAGEEFLRRHNL